VYRVDEDVAIWRWKPWKSVIVIVELPMPLTTPVSRELTMSTDRATSRAGKRLAAADPATFASTRTRLSTCRTLREIFLPASA
jgi:hypothetical protein